jgi:hypothetical protein
VDELDIENMVLSRVMVEFLNKFNNFVKKK